MSDTAGHSDQELVHKAVELNRIRWNCRRGMLELDLILGRFLDQHLTALTPDELERFKELLDYPDNDLLDLLMCRAELADRRCVALLDLMRMREAPGSELR